MKKKPREKTVDKESEYNETAVENFPNLRSVLFQKINLKYEKKKYYH